MYSIHTIWLAICSVTRNGSTALADVYMCLSNDRLIDRQTTDANGEYYYYKCVWILLLFFFSFLFFLDIITFDALVFVYVYLHTHKYTHILYGL